ncbi:septum formation initiator family protein [Pseudokineococcus basanitobsidens]|uniref:Septum formation initiator family protein n=1 Tax=Pseudokineococcus basanitobsidens TaxID=1926649 RepID=A0ABU8RMK5_9ACTN
MAPRAGRGDDGGQERGADVRTAAPGTTASPVRATSSTATPASLHLPARGDAAARARRAREVAAADRRGSEGPGRGRGLVRSLPAPRGLTRRAAAFSVLLLAVVAALAPYLHATISQRAEVAAAEAGLAQTRADVEDLEVELARWQDPLFVQREARERLALVMPGDRLYRVTGVSPSQQVAEDPRVAAAAELRTTDADRPWFGVLWDSVDAAGRETSGR